VTENVFEKPEMVIVRSLMPGSEAIGNMLRAVVDEVS